MRRMQKTVSKERESHCAYHRKLPAWFGRIAHIILNAAMKLKQQHIKWGKFKLKSSGDLFQSGLQR